VAIVRRWLSLETMYFHDFLPAFSVILIYCVSIGSSISIKITYNFDKWDYLFGTNFTEIKNKHIPPPAIHLYSLSLSHPVLQQNDATNHNVLTVGIQSLPWGSLDTSDCGKMLRERKIYILSLSIPSNLNGCVRANAISAENL